MIKGLLMTVAISLLLLLLTVGCAPSAQTATPPSATALLPNVLVHLVHLEGEVQVKRVNWVAYVPASFGMELRRGDLIRTGQQSKATISCGDGSLVEIGSDVEGPIPCPWPRATWPTPIPPPRKQQTSAIPFIISPRMTIIATSNPLLKWNPVSGATKYTVIVRGAGQEWRTETVAGEIVYPDDAPPLIPGIAYKLVVIEQSSHRSSEEEQLPGLGFSLLTPEEVQAVREAEAKIRALGLADAPMRFLIANLYAVQGLNAEAIELLEELSNTLQEPANVRSLGDLYRTIGLNRMAEERYSQALELSQRANDVEGQALAQNALGLIYEALGNKGEAAHRLEKAMELYQELGDSKTVQQIQEQLVELHEP